MTGAAPGARARTRPNRMRMTCETCHWELSETDSYCSWCGATLIDVELALDAPYLYAGDLDETLALTIRHAGAFGFGVIKLGRVTSDQPWLVVHAAELDGVTLEHGSQVVARLEANVQQLPEGYHAAKISLATSVGEREVVLEAVPKPRLDKFSTGGEHIVLLDNVRDEKLTGYLAITEGVVTVESLTTDVDWAEVEPSGGGALPRTVDARRNSRLEFEFKVDEERLLQEAMSSGGRFPVDRKGNLIVRYSRLEPERTYPFYVKCFLPPRLIIKEEFSPIKLEIFTGRRGEQGITLQNGDENQSGRADLHILEIKADVPWFQPTSAITYPLVIPSGQYHQVTYAAAEVGEGSRHVKLTVVTNTPGAERQKDLYLEVVVRPMPVFDGVLAIDFGTTNSCCAFTERGGRQGMIPIDDDRSVLKPTTASSTILYKHLFENGEKDYEVGSRAYGLSFLPAYAFSAVRQVKRRLGRTEHYDIRFVNDPDKHESYLSREVAADILRRILDRAEETVKGEIKTCTISHPSRFALRQIDDLKAALVSCGIKEEDIRTVHEPVAAALSFIQQEEVTNRYRKYHLMVYDFGGGTTDVTLMRVENERQPNGVVNVTPVVLGATGDPCLGGEDVTEVVMKLTHEKCENYLRTEYKDAGSHVVPFNAENFNDQRKKQLAQENRNRLRQWAEAAKIAISTYGNDHVAQLEKDAMIDGVNIRLLLPKRLPLAVIMDNKDVETFPHEKIVPQQEEINRELEPKIADVIELMKRLARNNDIDSPEVIMLSGKSSAMPIVEELIRKNFPNSAVERPPDLKECVVRGARDITESEETFVKVRVKFTRKGGLTATTSRLGIGVKEPDGRRMFYQLVDAGMPIGEAGLKARVEGVSLTSRRAHISILENTGLEDRLWIRDHENPNITILKTFKLEPKLVEWERAHGKQVAEQDIADARIELEVTPNLNVKLIAKIPGVEEPLEFEAEYGGGAW
jgi:molecular chaperone DnaK (HSP70)